MQIEDLPESKQVSGEGDKTKQRKRPLLDEEDINITVPDASVKSEKLRKSSKEDESKFFRGCCCLEHLILEFHYHKLTLFNATTTVPANAAATNTAINFLATLVFISTSRIVILNQGEELKNPWTPSCTFQNCARKLATSYYVFCLKVTGVKMKNNVQQRMKLIAVKIGCN